VTQVSAQQADLAGVSLSELQQPRLHGLTGCEAYTSCETLVAVTFTDDLSFPSRKPGNYVYYDPVIIALFISARQGLASAESYDLSPGPALGMFEVFGRTGPQNLRGPQFWTIQKLTCQVWPVYSLTLLANSLKLPPDVRF